MKIITQLVILTLSLLLVNAHDNREYCNNLVKKFTEVCTIKSCCKLNYFSSDYAKSGVYKISQTKFGNSADAYCDMVTDGGGWIVIQRNKKDSLVNFNKNWVDYEEGFGDLQTEFWYGLKTLHFLTDNGQWEMRVDYQENNKRWSYLHYNQFSVGSGSEEYPLTVGGFTGVGTDLFNYQSHPHNGMKFSTSDNDNDNDNGNCAASRKNGWWYNSCYHININEQPPDVHRYVLFSEMKIRPKDCIIQ